MIEEIEFDENLFFLQHVLFALDTYNFDKDILKLLNELKSLVDKKMFYSSKYHNKDLKDVKYKTVFYYED